MPQIYLIHGYNSYQDSHWFPWLQNELAKVKLSSHFIQLPEPGNPQKDQWLKTLATQLPELNEGTYFVAHSLGCLTLLTYLSQLPKPVKIGGVILVAGFKESIPAMPELDQFIGEPLALDQLVDSISYRCVISAADDEIVPTEASQRLAQELQADFQQLPTGGHFLAEEGIDQLPALLKLLLKIKALTQGVEK
ncbi:RBBP9/YdeN family alpha/beta hydrolase [Vagococcus salmoninarum]|uniref:Hydrolase n=1 Tax=Vagococcus salmoninarum TaxID=2739 RepID=A0A429ZK23_9ENTE|nr:alpha/beta hydrolase [Vagococcus salmoninarum]MBE9389910.1 serine hydrolase family protein [Vagococcus salmoninarum]RST94016.1 hypothetical protein CBF35_11215 [Vagococcus salmoninarum]